MALDFTIQQRNDNRVITMVDSSIGWGTTLPNITDIGPYNLINPQHGDLTLLLSVNINTTTSTILYDAIDMYTEFGPFTSQADLVFILNTTHFVENSQPLGSLIDPFPDGIYTIEYSLYQYDTNEWVKTTDTKVSRVLTEGSVRNSIYEKLRLLPTYYGSIDDRRRDINEAILSYSLLKSLSAAAYVAKDEELIEILKTLEHLETNTSKYTW